MKEAANTTPRPGDSQRAPRGPGLAERPDQLADASGINRIEPLEVENQHSLTPPHESGQRPPQSAIDRSSQGVLELDHNPMLRVPRRSIQVYCHVSNPVEPGLIWVIHMDGRVGSLY